MAKNDGGNVGIGIGIGAGGGACADTVVEELGGDFGGLWLEADRADRAERCGALGALAGDRLGVEWWLALAEVAL